MATRLEQELGIEHLSWFNVARGKKESTTSPNLYSPLAVTKPILSTEPPNPRLDD